MGIDKTKVNEVIQEEIHLPTNTKIYSPKITGFLPKLFQHFALQKIFENLAIGKIFNFK